MSRLSQAQLLQLVLKTAWFRDTTEELVTDPHLWPGHISCLPEQLLFSRTHLG